MKIENGIAKDIDFSSKEGKEIMWHSSAHLLASAIKNLYPNVKITIGPAIENGFYYDFDNLEINDSDFSKIEKEMYSIINKGNKFEYKIVTKKEALELFKEEPYKIELINALPENEKITTYKLGNFIDLCRGPHLEDLSTIKAVKIMSIAGAYWRGDSKNKMLLRVYAISFTSKEDMKAYFDFLEEAKKRDHKLIGKKLNLFSFSEYAPGFPFFHDNGIIVLDELVDYWKAVHRKYNYQIIRTPQIMNRELWEKSGHWEKYKENMYTVKIEDLDFAVKPMNCPGGLLVYNTEQHSYKEFPLRVGELGIVHRHEISGALNGLFRVRVFTQDDAHIFMMPEQITEQVKEVFMILDEMYKTFDLKYRVVLSTMPEKHIGDLKTWEFTENALKTALKDLGLEYQLNAGDGAFYGPKIDVLVKDSLNREHQCATIQLDANLPERFDINYIGQDGKEHRPVMIHRVIYGSLERFFGVITEHFSGKFPLWLNPNQIIIVPVANVFDKYALDVKSQLESFGLRVKVDLGQDTLNKKIREAEKIYPNYILIVGEKEQNEKTINVRIRDTKEQKDFSIKDFAEKAKQEYKKRAIKSSL